MLRALSDALSSVVLALAGGAVPSREPKEAAVGIKEFHRMSGSPFEIFRRNQKQLMVVLTGLAMFAFVFLDQSVTGGDGQIPRALSVTLIALACAGGMWIIGAPRGKGSELALYGALIGGVIAFIGLRSQGQAAVVDTAVGTFTREDMSRQAQRRAIANQFVVRAGRGQVEGFGGTSDEQLLSRLLLMKEVETRKISVSDEGVLDYINEISGNKLSTKDYREILRGMGIPESELFNVLKEELAMQLALQMDLPPAVVSGMRSIETPLNFWSQYKKLQVREALDAAAIPVEPFVALIPEPNDSELIGFFEAAKTRMPTPDGQPGFLQERKVKLAYVAAEFESFEKSVTQPTDEEIVAYYEKNKSRYAIPDFPGSNDMDASPNFVEDAPVSALTPTNQAGPELPSPSESPKPEAPKSEEPKPDAPKPDAPKSESTTPESSKSETPKSDSKPEDKPAEDQKPGGKSEAKSEQESARRSSSPLIVQPVSFLVQDEKPKVEGDDKPAEPAKPAEEIPAKSEEPKLTLPSPDALPPGPGDGPKEPKYRELDAALKLEIQETMLRERAFEAMGIAADRALDVMTKLSDSYVSAVDPKEQEKIAGEIGNRLRAYAAENKLSYVETRAMTQRDLMTSASESIGAAQIPSAIPFQPGNSVGERVFQNDLLYDPARGDSIVKDKRYAYWKIADIAAQVPEFADVKDEVTSAWKLAQARPVAEKRAKELAELLQKSGKPMTEALVGQTITGKPDSIPISVRETPRFSWLSRAPNLPFQFDPRFSRPQMSAIDGIVQPGREFMQTVFETLGPNEIGVAPNQPRSIYYVVQVKQRDATPTETGDNLGLRAHQQRFLTEGRAGFDQGPYFHLGRDQLVETVNAWRVAYEKSYDVTWNRTAETEGELPQE